MVHTILSPADHTRGTMRFPIQLLLLALVLPLPACDTCGEFENCSPDSDTPSPGSETSTPVPVTPTPLDPFSENCTDDVGGMDEYGSMVVGASNDFVPLCNGQILIGDRFKNQIVLLDVRTNLQRAAYQLSDAPSDIALDAANKLLYAAQVSANSLVRIDLTREEVSTLKLDSNVSHMTLGDDGHLFASLYDEDGYRSNRIVFIDGVGMQLKAGFDLESESGLLAYNRVYHKLIVEGGWGSSLVRYTFDSELLALNLEEELEDYSYDYDSISLSPSGKQLAFSWEYTSSGNYSFIDRNANDFTEVYGAWNAGYYPGMAVFSPDGKYLAASNTYDEITVFDALTHVELDRWTDDVCDYNEISQVAFSQGGKIIYSLSNCDSEVNKGLLRWRVFDP